MTDLNASEPIPATPKDWDSHHAEVEPGIILSALQWLSRSSLGLILAHWVSRFAPVCAGLRASRFACGSICGLLAVPVYDPHF